MSVAVASDGAGSIRIPAAFCGLFGHKPTRGVVPNPFAPFEPLGLSVIGPHARTVDDAAALLDVLAPDGPPHPRGRAAAHSSRAHRGPNRGAWLASVARPPTGLRVRVTTDNPVVSSSEPVIAAVQRVIRALEELGHQVEPGVRFEGQVEEFLPMFRFLARGMFVPREASLQASTRHLRDDRGGRVTLARALEARELFRARIDRWFEGCDVYVTPTVAMLPPRVGQFDLSDGEAVFREAAPYGAFTAAFNASGHPAATVPVRVEGCPLPLGVQLVGARGDDATLLALARALLEALGTPVLPTAPAR
jgi:amidase